MNDAMINPKTQAIFVHTIVNVIFKCMLQVKNIDDLFNNNVGVFGHIKVHYGCYKTTKNGLHIHTLLCCNNFPNPNTLIQALQDDEIFWQNIINYLNDIIIRVINEYKSCAKNIDIDYINDNFDDIHLCNTRPNLEKKTLQNYSKMTFINYWRYAIDMYVIQHATKHMLICQKKLCKYGFLQPLINKNHFNIEKRLLHIKRTSING